MSVGWACVRMDKTFSPRLATSDNTNALAGAAANYQLCRYYIKPSLDKLLKLIAFKIQIAPRRQEFITKVIGYLNICNKFTIVK